MELKMDRRTVLKALAAVPLVSVLPERTDGDALAKYVDYEVIDDYKDGVLVDVFAEMHIWYSECDFMIAQSAEQAAELTREMCGYFDEFQDGMLAENWKQWPDDKPFPLTEELNEDEHGDLTHFYRHGRVYDDLSPGEMWAYEFRGYPNRRVRTANVTFLVEKDGRIWHRTTKKLPREWIAEWPVGFFASTEA